MKFIFVSYLLSIILTKFKINKISKSQFPQHYNITHLNVFFNVLQYSKKYLIKLKKETSKNIKSVKANGKVVLHCNVDFKESRSPSVPSPARSL